MIEWSAQVEILRISCHIVFPLYQKHTVSEVLYDTKLQQTNESNNLDETDMGKVLGLKRATMLLGKEVNESLD